MNTTAYLSLFFLVAGILTVISIGVSWIFAKHFCTPKRKQSNKTPENYGFDFERISFPSHGKSLNGWFIPHQSGKEKTPTIIVAHGWSSNAGQVLPIASALNKAGFNTLLYDARSHGSSSEDNPITLQKFAEDVIAAIDYLETRTDINIEQVGLVGHSMGASGAILATSMDSRIRALVSSAAFADPVTLTQEYMRLYHFPRVPLFYLVHYFINRWLDTSMDDIAPKNCIGRITIPMLLLHGDADQVVSPTNMEILRSHAKPEYVQAQLISGGLHHSTIIRDPEYIARIIDFFVNHLESENVEKQLSTVDSLEQKPVMA